MFYLKNHQNWYVWKENNETFSNNQASVKFERVYVTCNACRNIFLKKVALIEVTYRKKGALINLSKILAYF